jgi:hypothetical protein
MWVQRKSYRNTSSRSCAPRDTSPNPVPCFLRADQNPWGNGNIPLVHPITPCQLHCILVRQGLLLDAKWSTRCCARRGCCVKSVITKLYSGQRFYSFCQPVRSQQNQPVESPPNTLIFYLSTLSIQRYVLYLIGFFGSPEPKMWIKSWRNSRLLLLRFLSANLANPAQRNAAPPRSAESSDKNCTSKIETTPYR